MAINEKYEASKKILLESYDLLMQCDPIIGKDSIPELKKLLKQEQFIISVCGAIKTGKSTLLNYLLFNGEETLPVNVTPETAKLAKIIKGPYKHAMVHFLSKAEWEEYKKTPNEQEIIVGTIANIKISDYISDTPYSIKVDDLKELSKYISKESTLAPLVKNADIYVDEKVMDNIVVVDTPGLNDPCKARSEVTLNWVGKTDALIYIMNTKQAFTKQDVEFLDEYCSHIMPEKIILVLGQIDRANFQEVHEYIANLLNSEDFSKREYLRNKKPYPISVMAAMLKNYPEKVKDADFYRNKINHELISEEGYMPALEEAINSSLMSSKGRSVLISHRKKILSLLNDTINQLEDEIILHEDKLNNYGKTEKEIEEKRKLVEKLSQSIKETQDEFAHELERAKLKLIDNELCEEFDNARKEAKKAYKEKCQNLWNSFDICLINTPSFFRERIQSTANDILDHDMIKDFGEKMNNLIMNIDLKLKSQIVDYDLFRNNVRKPIFSLRLVHDRIEEMVKKIFQNDKLQEQRERILLFFTKQEKSIENLVVKVDEENGGLYNDTLQTILNELENDINTETSRYFSTLMNLSEGVKKNLDNITYDLAEQQEKIEKIKGVIHDKKITIQQVQALKNEISAKLSTTFGG